MIVYNILDYIFSAPSNVTVLRVLNERVVGISGRKTARLAKISLRSAQNVLLNLQALKIVNKQVGGREHLFTLNRKNYISKKIISYLFDIERDFNESLFLLIKKKLGKFTVSIIVFGSVARREEDYSSDLDLCIVFSSNKRKIETILNELRDQLYSNYGINIAPFFITSSKFKSDNKKNNPPVNKILKDGVVISGKSINRLLNG